MIDKLLNTQSHQAARIFTVLAHVSKSGGYPIPYDTTAKEIGHAVRYGLSGPLDKLQAWCIVRGYPRITVLVVLKDGGVPSTGFIGYDDPLQLAAEREKVAAFDWFKINPPTLGELDAVPSSTELLGKVTA